MFDKSESSENSITARRATTACRFSCISQGAALILFKFCLISEAQPHSSSSHPIFSFPNLLIFFLACRATTACAARTFAKVNYQYFWHYWYY